jgi:IS605 OrfB family transposase
VAHHSINLNAGEDGLKPTFPCPSSLLCSIRDKVKVSIAALEHPDTPEDLVRPCVSLLLEVLEDIELLEAGLGKPTLTNQPVPVIDNIADSMAVLKVLRSALDLDGYYIALSLQDSAVPVLTPDTQTLDSTIGIDMGLKSFLVTDAGTEVEIPQHYRKAEKRLKRLQRALSRKKKGSNRRKKAIKRVAKAHLKVSNQRKDFHYKTANQLLSQGKNVSYEKLNIKGIARTRLAKSTHDAGWGQFLQILSIKAERAGLLAIAVNPSGTSQNCSGCGVKVPKTLSDRVHHCP